MINRKKIRTAVKFLVRNLVDFMGILVPVSRTVDPSVYRQKILIFNWRDTKHVYAGGAEVYIHELAKRWVKDGNKVTLFCGNDGYNPRYETVDGVEIVRRGGFYFVYVWAFFYYLSQFRGKYDVIIDCENGIPFFTPLYTFEKKRYLVIHHVHQDVFRKTLKPPFSNLAMFLEKTVMPNVYENCKIVTVSPSTKEEILRIGLTKKDVDVIYNGVDLSKLVPAAKSEKPMILSLGRLKSYKSIDVLVKAAAKIVKEIPDVDIVIAGDGEEKLRLKKLAKYLEVDKNVRFVGKVSEDQKISLYQKSWVFVNPSYLEGWGITSIEANACGTPVVASRVSGLKDSVRDGETGFLVTYGDNSALADKVIELIKNDKLRTEMSETSLNWGRMFDWRKSADAFLELIAKEEVSEELVFQYSLTESKR
jgi:glycosyltransferase involved in cell wall biosynthesis